MVTLSNEEIQLISFFESKTHAIVKDCIVEPEKIIFVVAEGNLGKAVGKGGRTIQELRDIMKKKIVVVEYRDNLEDFLKWYFFPTPVEVRLSEQGKTKCAIVRVREEDRGFVLGRGGEKIKDGKMLTQRYFDTDIKVFAVKEKKYSMSLPQQPMSKT